MEEILPVLRALIDAAFSSGGITDLVHRDLHAKVDAADPAAAAEAAKAPELTADEQAQLDALQAKQAAAAQAAAPETMDAPPYVPPAGFGTEAHPYA